MHVLTELALRALLLVLLLGLHVVEPCFDGLELGTMETGVMMLSRRVLLGGCMRVVSFKKLCD